MSAAVEVYGANWCGDCRRAKAALERLQIEYTWYDIEHDDTMREKAINISSQQHIPVVVYSDGSYQVEPSAKDIAEKATQLGLITE